MQSASAREGEANYLADQGYYEHAAEVFEEAARDWQKIKRFRRMRFCEARAQECRAMAIQDKRMIWVQLQDCANIVSCLGKAEFLLRQVDNYRESSRVAELKMLFQDLLIPGAVLLLKGIHEEALKKFDEARIKAEGIREKAQACFAQGMIHMCRSYILDADVEKIKELEFARSEFKKGKWPTRVIETEANICELKAMKSSSELDYERAGQHWLEAKEKWLATGNKKKARWCELSIQGCDLERLLFMSPHGDIPKLTSEYISLSKCYRDIGKSRDADWCEIWAEIFLSSSQNDNDSFDRARRRLETEFPSAFDQSLPSQRSYRRLRIILRESERLRDFSKGQEAFRLELAVLDLLRHFDDRQIEGEIFVSLPKQRLVLHHYTKVDRFVHNEPIYDEESKYVQENQISYPIEVDAVAERETANHYNILIVETKRYIELRDIVKFAKKAGAVEAYYCGKSRSEAPRKYKPIVDGKWIITIRDIDERCIKKARELELNIIGKNGLNLLLDRLGQRTF
jgi:hypothetical protein